MPDYIEWLESYSVGVRAFDDAHKKLLDLTNSFMTASMENKPLDQLTILLIDLIRYTHHHFRDEEELLKETGYELFEEQRALHDILFDQVLDFTDDFFNGRIEKLEITEFMMSWFLGHILEEDMKYKEHFAKLETR